MPSGAKAAPGPFSEEIASILRAQMARKKILQTPLAAAVGLSQGQLSGVLSAKKHVDIEQLDRISWALGLKLVDDVIAPADHALRLRQTEKSWPTPRLAD